MKQHPRLNPGGQRYLTSAGVEGAFEPGSAGRVLSNLKGITRKRDMDRAEYEALVHVQQKYLDHIEDHTRFTAALIRQMHRDWLGDLYPWAGIYRTVELSKAGFSWPPAYLVERNMTALEHGLLARKTPCRPGPVDRVLQDAAEVHAGLLLIHPFREGNGRLARWLAELMILQAGLPLPVYHFTGRGSVAERARYLAPRSLPSVGRPWRQCAQTHLPRRPNYRNDDGEGVSRQLGNEPESKRDGYDQRRARPGTHVMTYRYDSPYAGPAKC